MQNPSNIAELMIQLWRLVEPLSSAVRLNCSPAGDLFITRVKASLAVADESAALEGVLSIIDTSKPAGESIQCGQILGLMQCVDDVFSAIHPRSLRVRQHPTFEAPPAWLEKYRIERRLHGCYAVFESRRLIPRGPLLRANRQERDNNAEFLADWFSALSVAKNVYDFNHSPIQVRQRTIWTDATRGVPSGNSTSRVAVISVAEAPGDIVCTARNGEAADFLDYRLAPDVNGVQRVFDSLNLCGEVDIVVAPEFTLRREHVNGVAERLIASPSHTAFSILVAGSGQSTDGTTEQPTNECVALNRMGTPLLTQSKLWPASINKARAIEIGADVADCKEKIYEDIASGETFEVADIDSLGRCIVLICQDLESSFAEEVISDFQPDWVFVPILDIGIDEGRWMHQRAFALSGYSPARFVIACSMSWARKLQRETAFAMCLNPKRGDDGARGIFLCRADGMSNDVAVVDWSTDKGWGKSTLNAESPATS